jgi:hypothetical protein
MTTQEFLKSIGACQAGLEHVGPENLRDHWKTCPLGNNMLWVLARMAGKPGWPSRDEISAFMPQIVKELGYPLPVDASVKTWEGLGSPEFAKSCHGLLTAAVEGPVEKMLSRLKYVADRLRQTFSWPALDDLEG